MKEINYYLWKLKYLKANKISTNQVDVNNIPDNIVYNRGTGDYLKIETDRPLNEELDTFLRVKNAYNFNIIRVCIVVCTVFFVIAIIFTFL